MLSLPAVVVLFAVAGSCEDMNYGGLLPAPCDALLVIEPAQGFPTPIMLPVGSSSTLRVRLRDERDGVNLDIYRHCPSMSLDKFEWIVDDPSVVRLEGSGPTVTVTGLAVGRTWITIRYTDYVGRNGSHISTFVVLEVTESEDM